MFSSVKNEAFNSFEHFMFSIYTLITSKNSLRYYLYECLPASLSDKAELSAQQCTVHLGKKKKNLNLWHTLTQC